MKPSFLVLRLSASERNVTGVSVYHRFPSWLKMRQNWCHREPSLQLLKRLLLFASQVKILWVPFSHLGDRLGNFRNIFDELSIEVCESNEDLNFFNRSQVSPILNTLHFSIIHRNSACFDNVSQVFEVFPGGTPTFAKRLPGHVVRASQTPVGLV